MMKTYFKTLCFIFLLASQLLKAQVDVCTNKEIIVYFGNGMKNSHQDALDSLDELKKKLQDELPSYLNVNQETYL